MTAEATKLKTFKNDFLQFQYSEGWEASNLELSIKMPITMTDLDYSKTVEGFDKPLKAASIDFMLRYGKDDEKTLKEMVMFEMMSLEAGYQEKKITHFGNLKGKGIEITGEQKGKQSRIKIFSFVTPVKKPREHPAYPQPYDKVFIYGFIAESAYGKPALTTEEQAGYEAFLKSLKIVN